MKTAIRSLSFFAFFLFSAASIAQVQPRGFGGRAGVRLTGEGGVYGGLSIDSLSSASFKFEQLSAGWLAPVQVEITYSVTDAFELLLGYRYGFSAPFAMKGMEQAFGTDSYAVSSSGMALGYRYYFNTNDPIKAYLSGQVSAAFAGLTTAPAVEGRLTPGFQCELTDEVGLFFQTSFGLAARAVPGTKLMTQGFAALGLGLHYHF